MSDHVNNVEVMRKKRVRFAGTYGERFESVSLLTALSVHVPDSFVFERGAPIAVGDRLVFERCVYDVLGVGDEDVHITRHVLVEKNEIETTLLRMSEGPGAVVDFGQMVSMKKDHDAELWMDGWVGEYVKHIIAHYESIKNGRHVGEMIGMFDLNVPAACVGAGPSLDKNIEELRRFPGIILCADRAYKSLKARGINPDIVVSVDCHPDLICEMLKGPDSSNDLLVLNTCSDPKIEKMWRGKIFWFNMWHPGVQFTDHVLPELFPGFGVIENSGNVGNASVLLADSMGMSPIVLVGQDYGYTDGKMHADRYSFDSNGKAFLEVDDHELLLEKRTGKVKCGDVVTYASFVSYARSLYAHWEKRGLKITNCTEGGILTELPCKPLAEMCGELITRVASGALQPVAHAKNRIEKLKEERHVR